MKKACLVLMFTAVLSGSAAAAPPLLDRWETAAITVALKSLNAGGIRDATLAGQPGLLAATPDRLNIGLYAKACAPFGVPSEVVCRGLEGIVTYDPGNVADRALLVDQLNHAYAAGKFMVERDGTIRMTRYLNLEGGVTQANLKASLDDFFTVATAAKQTIWAAPQQR
jgi:hypothetical protein